MTTTITMTTTMISTITITMTITIRFIFIIEPFLHVARGERQVLSELEGSRRPSGQPPVVDGLHGDTEVLGELLDPDEGLQPQFDGVHADQVC